MPLTERQYAFQEAKLAVPMERPQRQDSTDAQLRTLVFMAERAGCRDAADWLKKQIGE